MQPNDEYLESNVLTASPQQLHLMVIEAAIRHATLGQAALSSQNYEVAHQEMSLSRDFVSEIISGLDSEQSPELVEQLKGMFTFCYRKLVEGDLHHDQACIEDALQIMHMHRDTWLELMESLLEEDPAEEQAVNGQATDESDWNSGSVSWTG